MSKQPPPNPPIAPKRKGPAEGKSPAGGFNWRVLILMAIAGGILILAWQSGRLGKPERLSYTQFREYVASGKIIVDKNIQGEKLAPKGTPNTFPDETYKLKKAGESAAVPKITGFYYKNDPWIEDTRSAEVEAFRIPINTNLHDDALKSLQTVHAIPLRIENELPTETDGELLTLQDLRTMLARNEVIMDDPNNAFEMVSRDGSNDKYIVGKRYKFEDTDPAKSKDDLIPFELETNNLELNDTERQFVNNLAPFESSSGTLSFVLIQLLPIMLIVLVIFFLFRQQMKSAGRGAMSFGKSKAKLLTMDKNRVTFKDVAGIEEAKDELVEIVEYLKDPSKFQKLGGNLPKGLLMVGPPGTGKTLLARAIAGEAEVPFFSISGSDFVEMFVGVGASRVRDMFEQGQKNAPCLIFIDEIDAVGRHRGQGMGGGHDEREQTLNALLVEMDGFDTREGVIIIAATNRPDVLDPALLRPGRFDRQVTVGLADVKGREQILSVHVKKIKVAPDTDLSRIARGTPGFSGAELANLINEAALLAARKGMKAVTLAEMEEARDKVRWGRERRSMALSDKEKENTAYHEAGHAILNELLDHTDPLHKVTIIPRGPSLGSTMFLPEEDKFTYRQKELTDQLCVAMGGRVAEELTFGNVTNGAVGDIRMATNIARKMVCEWGMSEDLGMVEYKSDKGNLFSGDGSANTGYSEETSMKIDLEIKKLIDDSYQRAKDLLTEHSESLRILSEALLEYETLDSEQVNDIMKYGEMKNPPSLPPSPMVSGNQSDGGVKKTVKPEKTSTDDDPLAGDVVGAPA
ncbi:MAG: ATP-dependent zinc metalloprotease FtsH [Akkermansiaceae bacterium]